MSAPAFSVADFTGMMQRLLPRGYVWPRDPDAVQTQVLTGLAGTPKRLTDAAAALLVDAFPSTAVNLLPEWEETLGLPDPCAGEAPTIEGRQQQVVAKLSLPGGQSQAYFIALAAKLGYAGCTITQYAPFRAGRSRCIDPCGVTGWFFVWTFNIPTLPVSYFNALSSCTDPLYTLDGGDDVECTIRNYAPAHTNVLFSGAV